MEDLINEIVKKVLSEKKKKRDRCLRIADRKYDKPSAYKSGAVVRCRKGDIWKDLKEVIEEIITEDESLHKWFKRQGPKGKEGGWVDCNAPDGKGGYKACGRKKGEKRSKYPSCRPTPSKCKDKGKGKKWGKTKTNEDMIKLYNILKEVDSYSKIYTFEGVLIINPKKNKMNKILSDIRAIEGITIVRENSMEQSSSSQYEKSKLNIKIDPAPFGGAVSEENMSTIVAQIKKIHGVVNFLSNKNVDISNV